MLNNEDIKKILQKQAQGEFGLGFDLQSELERLKKKVINVGNQPVSENSTEIETNEITEENIEEEKKEAVQPPEENPADTEISSQEEIIQTENNIQETIENEFNEEGFDKNGFDKDGFNREGFNTAGFDKEGFDREGFNTDGFNKEGFDREGFNTDGFDKEGFDREGFNTDGFDKEGFNREGFNKEGRDVKGFDINGIDVEGFDKLGFDRNGYNREGRDAKGFDKEGYNKSGFDRDGYDKEGFNWQGLNKEGYDKNGFDKFGYDKDGYNAKGYNRQGYDRNGFNWDGYDKYGYNAEGLDKDGFKKPDLNSEEDEIDLDVLEELEEDNKEKFTPENLIIIEKKKEVLTENNINFDCEEINFFEKNISISCLNEIINNKFRENFNNGVYNELINRNKEQKNITVDLDFTQNNDRYETTLKINCNGTIIEIINASIYQNCSTIHYSYISPNKFEYNQEIFKKLSNNKKEITSTITIKKSKDKLHCFEEANGLLQNELTIYTDLKGYKNTKTFKTAAFSQLKTENPEGIICKEIYTQLDENNNPIKSNEQIYQNLNGNSYVLVRNSNTYKGNDLISHEHFEAFNIKELPDIYKNENLETILEACPKQSSAYNRFEDNKFSYSCIYAQINYSDNIISLTNYTKNKDGFEEWNRNYSTITVSSKTGGLVVIQNEKSQKIIEKYQYIAGKRLCIYKKEGNILYRSFEIAEDSIVITDFSYFKDNETIKNKIITTYKKNAEQIIEQTGYDENNNIILEEKYIKPSVSNKENDKIYVYRKLYTYENNNLSKLLLKEYSEKGELKSYISKNYNARLNELTGSTTKEFDNNGKLLKVTKTGFDYVNNSKTAIYIENFSPEGKKISTHTEKYPTSFSKTNIGELFIDVNLSNVFITEDTNIDTTTGKITTKTLIKNNISDFAKILYTQTEVNYPGRGITTDFEQYDEYGNILKQGENIFQNPRGFVTWDNFAAFGARLRTFAYKVDDNGNIINNTRIPMDEYKGEYENNYSTLIEEMPNDWGLLRKTSQKQTGEEFAELEFSVSDELYYGEANIYTEHKKTNISLTQEHKDIFTDSVRSILTDGGEYIWKKEIMNPRYDFPLVSFLKKDDSSQKMFINDDNLLVIEKRTYEDSDNFTDEKIITPIYSFNENDTLFPQSIYEEKECYSSGNLVQKATKELLENEQIKYSEKSFSDNNIIEQVETVTDFTSARVLKQNIQKYKNYKLENGEKYLLNKEINLSVSKEGISKITKEYDYTGSIDNILQAVSELTEINNIPQNLTTKYFDENISANIDFINKTCSYKYNNISVTDDYHDNSYKFLSPFFNLSDNVREPNLELNAFNNNIIADCWYLKNIAKNNSIFVQDMIKNNNDNTYTLNFSGSYNNLFELFLENNNIDINISKEELNSNLYNNILFSFDNYEDKFLQIAYLKLSKSKQAQFYGNGESALNLLKNESDYICINANNIENIKNILEKSDVSMKIRNLVFLSENIQETETEILITREDNSVLTLNKKAIYKLHYNNSTQNIEITNPWYGINNEIVTLETIKNIADIIINKANI